MNINEALKKAAPGPLSVIEVTPGSSCSEGILARGDVYIARASSHKDAALLAHCYNHLPKVLETLIEARNLIGSVRGGGHVGIKRTKDFFERMDAIIAEASEVKGI